MMVAARPSVLTANDPVNADQARTRITHPIRLVLLQTQAEAAGAQEVSRLLGQGFAARGSDVHHIFLYRRTGAFDEQPHTFYCANRRPKSAAGVARMFRALLSHLRQVKPDAALCFQHYGSIIGALAARLAGVPVVIANPTSTPGNLPRLVQWTDRLFGTFGLFTRVVVNSQTAKNAYLTYPEAYRSRLAQIEHGFQPKTSKLTKVEARKRFGLPADATILSCIARLHPMKNLEAAVRLLPFNPAWHLALAGQGADRERLVHTAQDMQASDRLHLAGEVLPDEIGNFLAAADVFVFPSLAETFGLAPVEAAQAGIPVVANDLAVLREVLSFDGQPCALFVNANDSAAFAASVESVLSDLTLRARLIERGRGLSRRYGVDAMVQGYAMMLQELMPSRVQANAS